MNKREFAKLKKHTDTLTDEELKKEYYDDVLIIGIMFSGKQNCFIERGTAFGSYGSKQLTKIKVYANYKRKSKFTKFIDKWYEPLVEKLREYKK